MGQSLKGLPGTMRTSVLALKASFPEWAASAPQGGKQASMSTSQTSRGSQAAGRPFLTQWSLCFPQVPRWAKVAGPQPLPVSWAAGGTAWQRFHSGGRWSFISTMAPNLLPCSAQRLTCLRGVLCEGLETAAGALGRQTGSPGLQASVLPPQSLRSGGREKHAHPGSLGGWVGALLLNSVSEATSHGFWGGV